MGTSKLVTMNVEGNTGLDFSLDTGTGVGKEMGTAMDINGMQRIGHFSQITLQFSTQLRGIWLFNIIG